MRDLGAGVRKIVVQVAEPSMIDYTLDECPGDPKSDQLSYNQLRNFQA
jgi:hypothetical protein